jgi:hypothetical protein
MTVIPSFKNSASKIEMVLSNCPRALPEGGMTMIFVYRLATRRGETADSSMGGRAATIRSV